MWSAHHSLAAKPGEKVKMDTNHPGLQFYPSTQMQDLSLCRTVQHAGDHRKEQQMNTKIFSTNNAAPSTKNGSLCTKGSDSRPKTSSKGLISFRIQTRITCIAGTQHSGLVICFSHIQYLKLPKKIKKTLKIPRQIIYNYKS